MWQKSLLGTGGTALAGMSWPRLEWIEMALIAVSELRFACLQQVREPSASMAAISSTAVKSAVHCHTVVLHRQQLDSGARKAG